MGSRTEGLQRLLVIINKLKGKKRYIPARELKRYIAEAMEMRGYSGKSGRTLERDIDDIQSLFGITIAYAKREQGYYIKEEDENIPERYGKGRRRKHPGALRPAASELRPAQCLGRRHQLAHLCVGGTSPPVAQRVPADADKCH